MAYTLPNQLGGKDSKTISGGEPRLMFREASANDWYAVKSLGSIRRDINNNEVAPEFFEPTPSPLAPAFRSINPTKSTEAPKKVNPACNPTVCQACFYYCHVPHYNMCEIKEGSVAKGQSCEVDPSCALCARVCHKEADSNDD
jgi:Pyruvate/2-oxoacid:ferredoxin oxidoreductase delta subunit